MRFVTPYGAANAWPGRRGTWARARTPGSGLAQAAQVCEDIDEVIVFFGTRPYGHLRRYLFKRFAHFGIDVSHFQRRGYRRTIDRPCPTELRQAVAASVSIAGVLTVHLRRALHEIGVPERCDECGTGPEWLGSPMTLEVDHINGDWSDDRRENVRLLRPNCHAVTTTWCRGGRRRTP
ncbi:HNH endonuclease [Streptomyces hundungensis]|uniref:HNH endonuclease n=1 Tax=Streptomyces hundungensis TaxID=1077946 RepID=UPI0033CF8C79